MHVRPAGVLFKRMNDIWVPTMSRSESGHLGKKVNETVNISVCLGDMEERENKETILSWCHRYYWYRSGSSHVVSAVCRGGGGGNTG